LGDVAVGDAAVVAAGVVPPLRRVTITSGYPDIPAADRGGVPVSDAK
jgi:hypothetical protein